MSASPRSNAYHLLRLCWLIELGGDLAIGQSGPCSRALQEAYKNFPFLVGPTKALMLNLHGDQRVIPLDSHLSKKIWGHFISVNGARP